MSLKTPRPNITDRLVVELFVLAALFTLLAGLVAWLTYVHDWRSLGFLFVLSVMVIAWVAGIVLLATVAIIRTVRRSHKRLWQRIETAMAEHTASLGDELTNAFHRSELGVYIDIAQQRQRRGRIGAVD